MNDTTMTIHLKGREIILIGTAHVSRGSIDEVSQVIRQETPNMVNVELDEGRYGSMTQKENWEKLDVSKVFREGRGFLLLANLVLSGFQRRMGNELGVKPGEEMKIAVETAKELGIPYSLCDREVQITLRRAWARCGFLSKCKLLATLFSGAFTSEKLSEEEIENLKNRSELDGMMAELANYLPRVKETLIDERDRYLAAKIWSSGSRTGETAAPAGTAQIPEAGVFKQVAVVGAGHMAGIKTHLERIAAGDAGEDVSALDDIPPATGLSKALPWLIPVLIAALIVAGFFRADAGVSLAMLLRWVLWNGSLAALGTLIALGHPLSILVSFIGAPIATLNPFIGVGLFSGITEAAVRKPRVLDAQTISEDISSLRGIYRNRITRALLVFFLSSIGGAVGNFISIPSLASLLVK
ncbi:MAG: TraB/GumN family protein [Spirochaetaceae bacterium]|jgi:pheromone shutdown-related protein TraB|nr:TraB/GumN family protein [Spirochaetaceae bacterium]